MALLGERKPESIPVFLLYSISRTAFLILPSSRFPDIFDLIIMFQRRGWRDGPVHLFMLAARRWGLALASNTILPFVVTASV